MDAAKQVLHMRKLVCLETGKIHRLLSLHWVYFSFFADQASLTEALMCSQTNARDFYQQSQTFF